MTYQSDVDVIDLVSRIEQLETLVVDQRKELESMKVRTEFLENENSNVKLQLENVLDNIKSVTEKAIKSTTENVLNQMLNNQKLMETQTNDRFNSLNKELAKLVEVLCHKALPIIIANCSTTSITIPTDVHSLKQDFPLTCNNCEAGRTSFNFKRAYANHMKTIPSQPSIVKS